MSNVKMEKVESSQISEIGYDEAAKELHIRFRPMMQSAGSHYVYSDVPAHIHRGLLSADSIGSFFHSKVKKGGFAYRRIEPAA